MSGKPLGRKCGLENCDRKHYGHGYCHMHYQRWVKHGTTDEPAPLDTSYSVDEKRCRRCDETKPASEFWASKVNRDRLQSWCKPCLNWNARRWQVNNPDVVRGYQKKYVGCRKHLLKYGLDGMGYDLIAAEQGGVCAICRTNEFASPLHVDHDHATGEVRGLLCKGCNAAIGLMKDSITRLRSAADYLIAHEERYADLP